MRPVVQAGRAAGRAAAGALRELKNRFFTLRSMILGPTPG
jgi:hypothetical protein